MAATDVGGLLPRTDSRQSQLSEMTKSESRDSNMSTLGGGGGGGGFGFYTDPRMSLLGRRLLSFDVHANPIGDRGLAAIAKALDAGGVPNLSALNLSNSGCASR